MSMHSICNNATFQESHALLSATSYQPGHHVQAGQPSSVTDKRTDKIEEMLGASGGNLAYAGYPYDPYFPDEARH
jgi:hypothetical protein